MTTLRQKFYAHLRHGRGGYTYVYQIIDGDRVIGWKSEGAETRNSQIKTTYTLIGGCGFFDSAKDLIAAYEARKEKAA